MRDDDGDAGCLLEAFALTGCLLVIVALAVFGLSLVTSAPTGHEFLTADSGRAMLAAAGALALGFCLVWLSRAARNRAFEPSPAPRDTDAGEGGPAQEHEPRGSPSRWASCGVTMALVLVLAGLLAYALYAFMAWGDERRPDYGGRRWGAGPRGRDHQSVAWQPNRPEPGGAPLCHCRSGQKGRGPGTAPAVGHADARQAS